MTEKKRPSSTTGDPVAARLVEKMYGPETCDCLLRPPVDRRKTEAGVVWVHRYCETCGDGFWERDKGSHP